MRLGYFPDYQGKGIIKDAYLRLFGYPYTPRRNEARIIFDLLKLKKTEYALDVGCGTGIFTNYLAKSGYKVKGIDVEEADLRVAKWRAEKLGIHVDYRLQDIESMKEEDNKYDKIFSICVFEHVKNDVNGLKNVHRMLKPGGRFVLSLPNVSSVFPLTHFAIKCPGSIKKVLFNSIIASSKSISEYESLYDKRFGHQRRYSVNSITEKIVRAGFKLEKITFSLGPFGGLFSSLIRTLKIFEWDKKQDAGYKFNSMLAFALLHPISYPFYMLDNVLGLKGKAIIVSAVK